jgi:hypothetical protein
MITFSQNFIMKKSTILFSLLLLSAKMFAQVCVPGTLVGPGNGYILPDSATNFANACPGTNYQQILYIKAPKDTVINITTPITGTITADIDSFVFNANIGGLPTYLSVSSVPAGLPAAGAAFPKSNFTRLVVAGDSLACVNISGLVPTGTAPGTIALSAPVRAYLSNMSSTNPLLNALLPSLYPGNKVDTVINLDYYRIVVSPTPCWPSAVSNITAYQFDLLNCIPNPATNRAQIVFESAKESEYTFSLINAMGETVLSRNVKAVKGSNYMPISTETLSSGMYLYTLSDGKNMLSKKMTVNRD